MSDSIAESKPLLTDTHIHLNMPPLSADPDGVLKRARDAGVHRCIVPSYDLASWKPIASLAQRSTIFPAFGLHPWVAHEPLQPDLLISKLTTDHAVAIGEIGLDFKI
ncbi:TatD family hydrolase, partial [Myxococcota bacterium]|nr:TatD family hydrolase [Myxococcota bacterium]